VQQFPSASVSSCGGRSLSMRLRAGESGRPAAGVTSGRVGMIEDANGVTVMKRNNLRLNSNTRFSVYGSVTEAAPRIFVSSACIILVCDEKKHDRFVRFLRTHGRSFGE